MGIAELILDYNDDESIKTLSFYGADMVAGTVTEDEVLQLTAILKNHPEIEEIKGRATFGRADAEIAKPFFDAVSELPNLRRFDLGASDFGKEGRQATFAMIAECLARSQVEELILIDNFNVETMFEENLDSLELILSSKHLKSLDFGWNNLGHWPDKLIVRLINAISNNHVLEELHLNSNHIQIMSDEMKQAFADMLGNHPSLRAIKISGHRIPEHIDNMDDDEFFEELPRLKRELQYLLEQLGKNKNLVSFDIGFMDHWIVRTEEFGRFLNQIKDRVECLILSAANLQVSVDTNVELKGQTPIDCDFVNLLVDFIAHSPHLKQIYLSNNYFLADITWRLIDAAKSNPSIMKTNFKNNTIVQPEIEKVNAFFKARAEKLSVPDIYSIFNPTKRCKSVEKAVTHENGTTPLGLSKPKV